MGLPLEVDCHTFEPPFFKKGIDMLSSALVKGKKKYKQATQVHWSTPSPHA